MQLFARITKIDEATRRVYGVASSEAVDHTNESLDYEASKGYFTDWSNNVAKATDGKSVGNLRAMHGNVVAGKLVELQCDDVTKSFPVCAEVVDDNEWKKTLAGCYTGFSIGGSYVSKAQDASGVTRYVAKPNELSLVDLPCNPEATFVVSKADGAEELRKFVTTTDNAEALRKWAGSLSEGERAAVLAKLAPAEQGTTDCITKRQAFAELVLKCKGVAPVLLSLAQLIDKPLQKGMYAVGELADLLCELGWMAEDAEWEAQIEGDSSPVPEQLRGAVKNLAQILIAMANEEATELAARFSGDANKTTPTGDLHKGAPSPKEDNMDAALQKSLDTANADLAKAIGERDELKKGIAERDELLIKAAAALDERNDLIKKLEAMPEPVKVALRSVSKSDDIGDNTPETEKVLKSDGTVDEAATAIKKALLNPVVRR
jgi:hypothetical protein